MGLLDIFKRRDSVPEKVKTCEKTDSGANMVKEIREEILQKTAIPYMKLQLTDTKPSLFDSKVGGIGYVPHDAKIPEDSEGTQLRLLAQIDCAEITLEDFPHQGLLQFWILNDDVSGLSLGAQNGLQSQTADLLVERVAVIAGLRGKDDAAVRPLRGAGAALTGVAGALLLPGLLAAAGDLSAGQCGLRALTAVGQMILDDVVDDGLVGLDAEHGLGKLNLADLLAVHVVNIGLKHGDLAPFLSLSRKPSAGYERKPSAGSC